MITAPARKLSASVRIIIWCSAGKFHRLGEKKRKVTIKGHYGYIRVIIGLLRNLTFQVHVLGLEQANPPRGDPRAPGRKQQIPMGG